MDKSFKKPNRLRNYLLVLVYCLIFSIGNFLTAQPSASSENASHSIFKELQRDSLLHLTLETDLKQLIKEKYKEDWQPLTLKFLDVAGKSIEYEAQVRTRGNMRKKVCYYPPLKLKFKKEWLLSQGMDTTANDLKMVLGCKKGDGYSELLLKEYLTYRLYEAFTGYSFKTQLVDLKLVDIADKDKIVETYSFIIENEDEMASRLKGRCTIPRIMRSKTIDSTQLAQLALFEYMIGNTDWALPNSHNIRFVVTRDLPKAVPIAYDFDYSGLVNAPYAVHRESINLEKITDRHFLGSCNLLHDYEKAVPLFIAKKDTFYQIINDFNLLDKDERKRMINYLEEFYELLNEPKSFKRKVLDYCIKP